jgi:hypothetical protein
MVQRDSNVTSVAQKLAKWMRNLSREYGIVNVSDRLIYRASNESLTLPVLWYKIKLFYHFRGKKSPYVSSLNPIIIGGCHRSGTTLARALVGAHPEIASPQRECHILLGIKKRQSLREAFELSDREISLLLRRWPDRVQFIENVFTLYTNKHNKPLISVKAPAHIYFIDELFQYFPNMRFIHIMRDGRDTVCSLRTYPKRKLVNGEFVPTNTRNPFDYCVRIWMYAINRGFAARSHSNYIEIKYEDMVYHTVPTMEKLYDFLGLDMIPEDKLLGFYKNEIPEKHPSNIEIGQPLYKAAVAKWRKEMTEKEKALFKEMAGDLLIELGYERDVHW